MIVDIYYGDDNFTRYSIGDTYSNFSKSPEKNFFDTIRNDKR